MGALLSRTRSHLRSHLGTQPNPDRRCPFAASDGGLSGAAVSPTATQLPIRDVTGGLRSGAPDPPARPARAWREHSWSGGRGEFHPPPPTERSGTVSRHSALLT